MRVGIGGSAPALAGNRVAIVQISTPSKRTGCLVKYRIGVKRIIRIVATYHNIGYVCLIRQLCRHLAYSHLADNHIGDEVGSNSLRSSISQRVLIIAVSILAVALVIMRVYVQSILAIVTPAPDQSRIFSPTHPPPV